MFSHLIERTSGQIEFSSLKVEVCLLERIQKGLFSVCSMDGVILGSFSKTCTDVIVLSIYLYFGDRDLITDGWGVQCSSLLDIEKSYRIRSLIKL